jgi:hypothetical protein
MDKQRTEDARSKSDDWSVDYIFDVPLDTAAAITGYRHDRAIENDFFRNLPTLVPTNGNVLTKLSQPPRVVADCRLHSVRMTSCFMHELSTVDTRLPD